MDSLILSLRLRCCPGPSDIQCSIWTNNVSTSSACPFAFFFRHYDSFSRYHLTSALSLSPSSLSSFLVFTPIFTALHHPPSSLAQLYRHHQLQQGPRRRSSRWNEAPVPVTGWLVWICLLNLDINHLSFKLLPASSQFSEIDIFFSVRKVIKCSGATYTQAVL